MRRIDQLFTAWPFLGSRRITAMLNGEGCRINRKRVQRLMRKMGIAALGPKPRTTTSAPGHKIFPYLLRQMVIDRPNQVWAADITYGAPRPTVGEAYDWNAKEKGGLEKK
ncbi:IS3 family transposase [Bradyrhizobium sp. USDA 313]|uniref:IS3 family transposase n=1 Tax=Bradyrhizobium sp. USDA 313 TaxID=3156307 RepID=UPI0035188170